MEYIQNENWLIETICLIQNRHTDKHLLINMYSFISKRIMTKYVILNITIAITCCIKKWNIEIWVFFTEKYMDEWIQNGFYFVAGGVYWFIAGFGKDYLRSDFMWIAINADSLRLWLRALGFEVSLLPIKEIYMNYAEGIHAPIHRCYYSDIFRPIQIFVRKNK